jgi:hypothetical protein
MKVIYRIFNIFGSIITFTPKLTAMNLHSEDNYPKLRLFLLPRVFKSLGYSLLLILAILVFFPKLFGYEASILDLIAQAKNPDSASIMFYTFLNISLFFIAWSKERKEDELILLARLKNLVNSFFIGIAFAFIVPFVNLIANYQLLKINITQLISVVLIIYLLSFNFQNRR